MTATTIQPPRVIARSAAADDRLVPDAEPALTPAELVRRMSAIRPLAAAYAEEAERIRRPVDAVWNEIRRTGAFLHFVPKRYGGLEYDLTTFIDGVLPIAEACASTGWVTAFCMEHNWLLAQFPKAAQDEIFGAQPYIIAPGVTTPPGAATPTQGGYRLTGRWRWGTGVMHADWILATGLVPTDKGPSVHMFVFPAAQADVLDTWRMDGMAGTGSHDIRVEELFVPAHRAVSMEDMRYGRAEGARLHDSPLFRMPMLPFLALTAVIPAVGAARASVGHFRARMNERLVYLTDGKHAERPAAQMRLAQADLKARTAELLVRDAAARTYALGERSSGALVEDRISIRAQIAWAMDLCRDAVRTVCDASGSSAHALDNPLQRALRDVNVMASHVVFDFDAASELHGRAMVGLPPNSPLV